LSRTCPKNALTNEVLAGPGCGFAIDQFAKTAVFLVLVQECKIVLIEQVEKCGPRDLFKRFLAAVAGIIDAKYAGIRIRGAFYLSRMPVACLDPLSDLVVIGRRFCLGHIRTSTAYHIARDLGLMSFEILNLALMFFRGRAR